MRKQLIALKELQGDLNLIEAKQYEQSIIEPDKYEKLLSCIDKILANHQTDADLLYQKGVILFQKDDYQGAIEYFRKALDCNANNNSVIQNLGISYKAVGNYEEALNQFNNSLRINPKNNQVEFLKGDTLRLMKRFKEAEDILSQLYHNQNDNVQVITGLIELKLDQDLINDVSFYVQKLESLKDIDIEPFLSISHRLAQAKLEQQALTILSKIISHDNKIVDAWYSLGIIQYNLDKFTEALKSFEKVIELDGQNTSALLYLALSFGQLNRYQDALQIFGKLLQINPKDAAVLNNKGIAYRELKQHQQALNCFDEALQINPTNPLYKINRALLMIEINRTEGLRLLQEAKDSFNSDLQLENNQVFTSVNIQYMQDQFQLLEQSENDSQFLEQYRVNQTKILERKQSDRKLQSAIKQGAKKIQTLEEASSEILNYQDQNKDMNVSLIQQSCINQGSNSNLIQIENSLIGGQQGSSKKKNIKLKIEQLTELYQQLEQKINTIQLQIQLVGLDKRASICKQLQELQQSAAGMNQIAYYKAFFWTLFNYMQAYANQSTGLFQHNTNQTLETTTEKAIDSLEQGLTIGVKISASIPLVNTVLSTIHSAIHTIFKVYKNNKHQDRIEAINEIIQKKVLGLTDLELQISIAALDLSFKKLDMIKDLDKIERKYSRSFTQEIQKIINRMMESRSSLYQGGAGQIGLEDALNCLGYYYQNGLIDEDQELSQQIISIIIEKRYAILKTDIVDQRDCLSCSCQIQ